MRKLEFFENKRIFILGLGKEGLDSLAFFRKIFSKKIIAIGDRLELKNLNLKVQNFIKKDKNLELHLGADYLENLKNYDVIVKSPGIPPKEIEPFLGENQIVTSQTEIFFDNSIGTIVGITGTKGKSTTASLIYNVLKKNGLKAYLVGNIGKPVLSFLDKEKKNNVYVYELSCHQLFNLKKSPHIAVFLNVFPEHLDYYKDFKEYLNSKSSITKYQAKNDFLIFNSENKFVNRIAKKSNAKKIPLKSVKLREFKTCLIGNFNQGKIKAALAVGRIFDIPDKKILAVIKNFKPLPHRLEYVGTYKGIKFYNDALSTIPEATIAALDTLGNNVEILLLGGLDRGISFAALAKRIIKSKVKILILFPTTGEKIWLEILRQSKKNRHKVFLVQNMKDAVKLCFHYTKKGKTCLLSTASPSFTIFKDYKEKGNLFKKYVKRYGKSS